MPVFEVSSSSMRHHGPQKRRPTRLSRWQDAIQRQAVGGLIIAALIIGLSSVGLSYLFFIMLPVLMSLIVTRSQLSNLIHTPGFGLLFFYHGPPVALIIVVTTTLAWAVILTPLHTYVQALIDQHFNRRKNEAARAVSAFTSTLREEIDLDKVCDGLLVVVQKTMQPRAVSVWTRKVVLQHAGSSQHSSRWDESLERVQHEEGTRAPASEKPGSTERTEFSVASDDPLLVYALKNPAAMEVERLQLDSPVLNTLRIYEMEIALPLVSQGELIGLLTLGLRLDGEEYTREDRALLNTLATQVAPALRVAQMVQEQQAQVRERERIEQELRTAQYIQHSLLPEEVPFLAGWRLTRYYQPAREVGGDFYDFLPFEDGRLGIVIGDVTDKGVPAALVMATTHTMLRAVAQVQVSPGEVLARVNELLYAEIPPKMFVTCFYAILDPGSGRVIYANAGHDLPYRRLNGSVSEIWAAGMPLGMMPDMQYDEHEVTLAPGESLLFYTDGLVEAHNPRREMFSFPRLKTVLASHADGTSLIDVLLDELKRFTGDGWEQEDDVTMVLLQRASEALTMNAQQG
jgi:serine phosphatase RsbU (regulator of sigma subunit)